MTGNNFTRLFRKSVFAQFDPKIPAVFARSAYPKIFEKSSMKFKAVHCDPLFGLKREPPKCQYGKPIEFVSFRNLDGKFGMADFCDAKDRVLRQKLISGFQSELASSVNSTTKVKIPGRIVQSCDGGFIVGIGPLRALLPQSEIPAGVHFNFHDMMDRKAFYFRLKTFETVPFTKLDSDINVDVLSSTQSDRKRQTYSSICGEQGANIVLSLRKQ